MLDFCFELQLKVNAENTLKNDSGLLCRDCVEIASQPNSVHSALSGCTAHGLFQRKFKTAQFSGREINLIRYF